MLILQRKRGESVMIGDDIRVVLVELRGDKARIGFEVPKSMPVYRQEVYDAIKRSGEVASPGNPRVD